MRIDRDRLNSVLTQVVEVAYPPRCAGCGLRGRWVCDECLQETPLFQDPRCPICSLPTAGAPCDCRDLPHHIDRLWVAGPYDAWLRHAVYSYKFNGETARAPSLAALLVEPCRDFGQTITLVPVPMHRKRKRERGYDQVDLLARAIGKQTGQPVRDLLVKERETHTQVGLTAAERSSNLVDAFSLRGGVRPPDEIILVDDVTTTGSTFGECASVLRNAGVHSVFAVAIAHGL